MHTARRECTGLRTWIYGVTGNKPYSWSAQRSVDIGMGPVTHSFLVISECPYSLLGLDLFMKMQAQIHFSEKGTKLFLPDGQPLQILMTHDQGEEYRFNQKPLEHDESVQV